MSPLIQEKKCPLGPTISLSLLSLFPASCAGGPTRKYLLEGDLKSPPLASSEEEPRVSVGGANPMVSGSFSSTFRNRYNGGGFFIGDGPVDQNLFALRVENGAFRGFSGSLWANYEINSQSVNEVDVGAWLPSQKFDFDWFSVQAQAGMQHWMFPTGLIGSGVTSAEGSIALSTPSGFLMSFLGRHAFESSSTGAGDTLQIDASQRVDLGNLSFSPGIRFGKHFDFFSSDGWYLTPRVTVDLPLSSTISVQADVGYQVSDGSMENGATAGVGISVKF